MAEGFKDFTAGAVAASSEVDDYLMRQSVMRFADSSARDSALSGVLVEGLLAYLKDVDTVTMYTGSAWTTAAYIGAHTAVLVDILQEDGTPCTWDAAAGFARYSRQGRKISGSNVHPITVAGSATNGEAINVSMPVAPRNTTALNETVGIGWIYDSSGPTGYPVRVINYGGVFRFMRTDAPATSWAGIDPAFALAIGDVITFNYEYEAAA